MKADNPFKTKLYHHTLPVRDELWEAIEKQLPSEEKEKRFPLFWMILFASTIASGALMFGLMERPKASPATPPIEQPVTETPGDDVSVTGSHEDAYASDASTISAANAKAPAVDNHENTGLPKEDNAVTLENLSGSKTPSAVSSKSNSGKSTANNTSTKKLSNRNINTGSKSSTLSATPIDNQPIVAIATKSTYTTSLLPLTEVDALHVARDLPLIKRRYNKPDPSCYKFSSLIGEHILSIDGFAGPGISPRSFSYSNPEHQTYFLARKTTENMQYAWAIGGRLNLHLKGGLALSLGLLYDQAGDVFDYTDTLATRSTTVIDTFFDANGNFLYTETHRVLIFGTLIKKIHNTYRHLDMPLLASFELPINRSALIINAGPVFNLIASHEGQILDPTLHPRTISKGDQNELDAYRTSLGISFYLGAGAVLPMTDRISFLIEPRYLYRIKPVTIKDYPLEEHRHYAGLNIGLRYLLD